MTSLPVSISLSLRPFLQLAPLPAFSSSNALFIVTFRTVRSMLARRSTELLQQRTAASKGEYFYWPRWMPLMDAVKWTTVVGPISMPLTI